MFNTFVGEMREHPTHYLSRLILLTVGALVAAFGVTAFLLPADVAPSGVTGLAVIVQEFINIPIAIIILLANIPIQMIAFRILNGWKTVVFTIYTVVLYSGALEVIPRALGDLTLTDDAFLSAVLGGVIVGIGGGLIYRAGGTVGGTSTIAQMLRQKFGLPLSSASLYSDTLIIVLVGIVLGWESALYAMISVFLNRIASDHVLEGPSDTATAIIVTDYPKAIRDAVADDLSHGMTYWDAKGTNVSRSHNVIMVAMLRSETARLIHIIRGADEEAFVTVLTGQSVYGDGFHSMKPKMPLELDEIEV